jgi:hypothetical protein
LAVLPRFEVPGGTSARAWCARPIVVQPIVLVVALETCEIAVVAVVRVGDSVARYGTQFTGELLQTSLGKRWNST